MVTCDTNYKQSERWFVIWMSVKNKMKEFEYAKDKSLEWRRPAQEIVAFW